VTDFADRLRPATAEEWPAFSRAFHEVFGEDAPASAVETVPAHAELDRSLGLWDGDRVVATAGIYSRELTTPGAVVPCAGVTWVSVAPTHRRRGVRPPPRVPDQSMRRRRIERTATHHMSTPKASSAARWIASAPGSKPNAAWRTSSTRW